jgi:hypothetical protein
MAATIFRVNPKLLLCMVSCGIYKKFIGNNLVGFHGSGKSDRV